MKTSIEFFDHANNEIVLPMYSFSSKDWLEEVKYKNTLIGAMHPGIPMCLGKVPTRRELKENEAEINRYIKLIRGGIELGGEKLHLNFSSNSRTHGVGIFTKPDIASIYFGPNNPMSYVNYGSILMTSCRKMLTFKGINVLIVDDEHPDIRKTGLGDSHGKCSPRLLSILSEGIDRVDQDNREFTPIQVRIGFPNKFLFKGTLMGWNNGVVPAAIRKRYKVEGEGSDWDLILTLSGIKGNKPADGTNLRKEPFYIGLVHPAEFREAKVSQQFFMWFTKKAIEQDVLPGINQECQKLEAALKDRTLLPDVLRELDRVADSEVGGQIDPESGEPISDVAAESYIPPVVKILDADKNGVLLEHPYINSKIRQLLGRTWLRLALNGDKRFTSFMMQPDDSIPENSFVCNDLPPGPHIVFRNPILSAHSIRIAHNVRGFPYYEKLKGVAVMSHDTASSWQGDFDGDFVTIIPLNKKQQEFVIDLEETDPAFADADFEEYIKGELEFDGDEYLNIVFEVFNFQRMWGRNPVISKPDKVKSNKSIEEIFYISMDNPTGLISSTIQSATTNGSIRKVLKYRKHNLYTNEYTSEYYEASILEFLAQQMQISVDRLKSTIYNDMEGIKATREYVLSLGRGAWFGKSAPGETNFYKSRTAYVTHPIPVGTLDSDGVITDEVNELDVVSSMISIVNSYWEEWAKSTHHVSEYRFLFPEDVFDFNMLDRASKIHKKYGTGISKAMNIGRTDESDKNGADFLTERKKAVLAVMTEIDNTKVEQEVAEENIREEVDKNGPYVLEQLAGVEPEDRALANRLIPSNRTSEFPIDGVWEAGDGEIKLATKDNYAAAMWYAAHSNSALKQSTGSTPFFLHSEEIISQLNKLEKKVNKTIYFGSNKNKLGDFIFASPDCVERDKSGSSSRPRPCVKRDGDPSIFMPSRIDGNKLADVNSDSGVIVPNTVEIIVKDEGVNNDRAKSKKYAIYVRSNESKPWSPLGNIGAGRPVPTLEKVHSAKLYTQSLTNTPEKLLSGLANEEPRLRSKGGILIWEEIN